MMMTFGGMGGDLAIQEFVSMTFGEQEVGNLLTEHFWREDFGCQTDVLRVTASFTVQQSPDSDPLTKFAVITLESP